MFVGVILACNLITNECSTLSSPNTFTDKATCNIVASAFRDQLIDTLPKYALVMFKCVEFPKPA